MGFLTNGTQDSVLQQTFPGVQVHEVLQPHTASRPKRAAHGLHVVAPLCQNVHFCPHSRSADASGWAATILGRRVKVFNR